MGSVADRIAKKIVSSRGSKVVDLASWREGRKMALEAGFGDDGLAFGRLAGHDPCHALYALAQNVASLMSESISGMREAKGFVRIVGAAEDVYMPAGPPMSPLTVSYFTMWALFDVRFGSSRETMGSCILRIAPEFDCPSWLMDAVQCRPCGVCPPNRRHPGKGGGEWRTDGRDRSRRPARIREAAGRRTAVLPPPA